MFLGDEAECRDIELVKMVDFISKSDSLFEEQAVGIICCSSCCNLLVVSLQPPTTSSLDSESLQCSYEALYRPKGQAPKLAIIVRLRMLQDTLLHLRLQQAKLTLTILEIQAAKSKACLELAVEAWQESLSEEPSTSMQFPPNFSVTPAFTSLFQISLEPTQHANLPQIVMPKIEGPIKPQVSSVLSET
jgi:hypothetical protein